MANRASLESKLQRYTERQGKPAWGVDYKPAIKATREEAPRISRPTILLPRKLGFREMHLLSDPETSYALLALHHPLVFDIHEQHVLSTMPALHPLATHSEAKLLRLSELPGTIAVAERLDMLSQHPRLFLDELGEGGEWVPFPYVGDLLLFLRDAKGVYCVNWTIKLEPQDFRRDGMRRLGSYASNDLNDDLRHQLEIVHFADAGIRTEKLALSQLDTQLWLNLRLACAWDARPIEVESELRAKIITRLRAIVGTQVIAFVELKKLAADYSVPDQTVKWVLYSAIWQRHIRVDLFRPILMSRPLSAERVDPFCKYASWFGR